MIWNPKTTGRWTAPHSTLCASPSPSLAFGATQTLFALTVLALVLVALMLVALMPLAWTLPVCSDAACFDCCDQADSSGGDGNRCLGLLH